MYLSPGGFQFASGVGSTQPDPTARGCGLTSGSDADPCGKNHGHLPHLPGLESAAPRSSNRSNCQIATAR